MHLRVTLLVVVLVAPTVALQLSPLSRRAVLGGAVSTLVPASLVLTPSPASARSKEKAKEKAVQKETAAEARQAMKEYKFAPRPELEGNAETGYKFKEGTIGSGSQGEVASYFKEKGSSAEFRKKVDPTAAFKASKGEQLAADAPKKKPSATKELTEDEKRINAALNQFKGQKDDMGRVIGGADLAKTAATVELDATEEDLALMRSLRGGKKF